ncbi:hypothetical protein FGO68_gene14237 [Halteria grandinella]|uniref:Uncharacterized protein n=1 Tax=Halteria grandinella TaxID=5974 RepID=A0A8J8P973_HALGN|nr:hypothetical protein FGO68_gene14237 [Halteria grandinella]
MAVEQYPSVTDNQIGSFLPEEQPNHKKQPNDIDEQAKHFDESTHSQVGRPAGGSNTNNEIDQQQQNQRIDYLDELQQKELLQQFERLEERGDHQVDRKFQIYQQGAGQFSPSESSATELSLRKIWAIVRDHLFKVNYVLQYTRACSKPIYHIMMLFEFLQMAFLTYYGWSIQNGFVNLNQDTIDVRKYIPKLIQTRAAFIQNVTQEEIQLRSMLQAAQTVEVSDPVWKLDYYVKFSIPSVYLLQSDSKSSYIAAFWGSISYFYAVIFILLLYSPTLFGQLMGSTVTSTPKLLSKLLSFLLLLILSVLQIPFFVILMQAFNCAENPLTPYTIQDIACDSQQRSIMVPFAIVTLLVYALLFVVETHMLQIVQFGSEFPWAGNDRHTAGLKIIARMVLVSGFIFDKNSNFKVEFILIACALYSIQLYRRFQGCNYYDKWINFAHTFYDVVITYHLFFIGVHILAYIKYSIIGAFIFICTSIIFHGLYYYFFLWRNTSAINKQVFVRKASSEHCEMFMQLLFKKFNRSEQDDQMIFFGCLKNHIEDCFQECNCSDIFEKIENIHKFNKFKNRMHNFHLDKPSFVEAKAYSTGVKFKTSKNEEYFEQAIDTGKFTRHKVEENLQESAIEGDEISRDLEMDPTKGDTKGKEELSRDEEAIQMYEEIIGHSLEHEYDPSASLLSFDLSLQERERIRKLSLQYFALLLYQLIQRFPKTA